MSVIENAIKRLQASRGAAVPASPAAAPDAAVDAAARQREDYTVPEAAPATPPRTIGVSEDALRAAGLLPPPHQERELAQQFRQIKRPIINRALGRGVEALPQGNLVMVASAVPGEGKTFISLNLALSMRLEEDVTVLLVDGDVVNPRMSQVLGADSERGLLDLIKDPTLSLGSLILPTDIPGLSFLPAGRPDDKATELLASARMHQVVTQLAAQDPARLVLFDSAPLLLTTESHALAQLAGQILLVVRAGQTAHHVVLEAIDTIAEDKSVSLVLNQSMRQPHTGYYYQYGSTTGGPRDKASGN
jgi:exopolysaccharide/PEP-CTERM locus tyrosine autokinase